MGSLSMLFYVVECFTVNLEKLAADAVRGAQIGGIDEQVEGKRGFIAKTLGETAHQIDKIGGLHADRAQVCDKAAEVGGLIFDGLLERSEAVRNGIIGGGDAAAKHIELNFNAEQSLKNAVVQVTRDARALCFDGAGAQMAQQEEVFERRSDVPGDAFKPGKIVLRVGLSL